MPGRNADYNEQLGVIRGSQREGYNNSPEFNRMNEALRLVNEAMTRMAQEGYRMTGDDIGELRALYTEAAIAVDRYIEHLPTWVPNFFRSGEGIRRQAGVYRLKEFITEDMAALDNYRVNNPMGLEEFLTDARNQVFEEPEEPLRHVGNVLSDRSVVEANGVKGVFTENTNIMDSKGVFGLALARENAHLPEHSPKRPFLDEFYRINTRHNFLKNLYDDLGHDEYNKVLECLKACNFNSGAEHMTIREETRRKLERFNERLERDGSPYKIILTQEELNHASPENIQFNIALGDMLLSALHIYATNDILKDDLKVAKDSSVGDRNTAMSIVSDLIYRPNLLARSSDMKMKLRNGQTIRGCYMEWAPGSQIGNLGAGIPGGPEEVKNARVEYDTSDIVKEAGDMLALDYICGNIDRHMDNFHVGLQKGADGIYYARTMKGIDNDQSFPVAGPKEMKELKGHYSFIRNVEDFACMKRSTANTILALTKEKLTFALRHKLTEKEINAAWERTKFLQENIRKGMNHRWKSNDEIKAGMIHVIPDDSKAWDRLTLSKIARVSAPNSIYTQIHRTFVNSGMRNLKNAREDAVAELESPALRERYRQLLAEHNPAVEGNPDWVLQQASNLAANNEFQIDNLETERHTLQPDGMLLKLPNASQVNVPFKRMGERNELIMEAQSMYDIYHTRRNMSNETMNKAYFALRYLEDEQMADYFPAGYAEHSVVRAAGMDKSVNRYYIDGEPAEDYARRKYWSRDIASRYNALGTQDDKDRFMRKFTSAHIVAAMTSGRHHVDVVCLSQDDNGRVQVKTYEMNVDLDNADMNGRQKRIDKLAQDTGGREKRQRAIRNSIRDRLNAKVADGSLNQFRDNVIAWRNAQNAQQNGQNAQNNQNVQNNQNEPQIVQNEQNPNRVGRVEFEEINVQRPRSKSFYKNANPAPAAQNQAQNQNQNQQGNPEARSIQTRRRGQ